MDYFRILPEEVVLEIFSFLPVHTVRCVVPLVCQSWKALIYETELWKSLLLKLSLDETTCVRNVSSFRLFMENTPQVQNIYCSSIFKDSLDLLNIIPACGVAVRQLHIPKLTAENLETVANLCSLQCLGVENFKQVLDFTPIQRLFRLSELDVGRCAGDVLVAFMSNTNSLTHLRVRESCDRDGFDRAIPFMVNIRQLEICTSDFTPTILSRLSTLPKLNRLSVVDDMPSQTKLLALTKLPLVNLKLSEPFLSPVLTSSALVHFFSTSNLYHLLHLTLKDCRINDAGALSVRNNCPMLRSVDLEKKVPDSDADLLTPSGILHFFHLRFLRILDITINNGTDWGYKRIHWKAQHVCDSSQPCPVGLDVLLEDWEEISLNVE